MKRSNILVAVFAVLAAASMAKAGEIDFDGAKGLKPQSLHDIFAANHQIVPEGVIKAAPAIDPAGSARALHSDDPCCDNPLILCFVPCREDGDLRKSAPQKTPVPLLRSGSYKTQQAQLAALREINASVIKSQALSALLDAPGTELWFRNGRIFVMNLDMKARFTIRELQVYKAVHGAGRSDQRAFVADDVAVGIIAEGVHVIWDSLTEYGSWPPIPDSGMAHYDPVTGNDYSPGWGE